MISAVYNRQVRAVVAQAAYLLFWAGLVLVCVLEARANLNAQHLTTGFDFLWKSTGWDVTFSLIEYKPSDPYWKVLLIGVMNTLFLGAIGLVLATVVGVVVGMARTSQNDIARLLGTIYVEIFRNIPLIVQVFFWYAVATRFPAPRQALSVEGLVYLTSRGLYVPGLNITGLSAFLGILALLAALGLIVFIAAAPRFRRYEPREKGRLQLAVLAVGLAVMAVIFVAGRLPELPFVGVPELKGLAFKGGIRITPELAALAFAIAIYGGAYIGEIVRGGFKAVGHGQVEAAEALGLTPLQVFTKVRFPLALRAMLPILTNQYVWLIKATTMGIAIGFTDFFMVVSISINQSGQTLELIGILMAGFLIINFGLAAILNTINRAIALKGDQLRT
ncbi:ABC transporter permease [Acuticoccus sediminis]|uniref:ABC transporter permease n=1 Tax=Acuticoccus sediminis TaxID=2184697 RepID=A0A8B2NYK2_9HYPH|nr:ABC transporter permease subunit [Acuticoccus sediminis]RAI01680.1 ABC transporter permease [Acuticoccus sediminis]